MKSKGWVISGLLTSEEVAWIGFICTIFVLILIIILLSLSNIKRRKVEKALRESEERLRTVINSLPDIICFKDAEGRWIDANKAMLNLYNSKVSILGKTDHELSQQIPGFREEFEACQRTDSEVWKRARTTTVEETFHQPSGELRTFDVVKVPLFHDDGSKKGLVVLGREITERKKAEEIRKEAAESSRLLDELRHYEKIRTEFFANLSHELRTPLNLILAPVQLIQLIKETDMTEHTYEKLQSYVNVIKQNCYRLTRIVNNLIDITKIDSGYLELELQNENIVSTIENITLSVKDYMSQKDLDLVFDTDIEEKIIGCDPDKIERIILNLLSNAIKFTPPGGKIEVKISDKVDKIQVSVRDTGIGIPKERQAAVFEKFVQVDKSLSRNREGSGIGLSLVKSFVEMHGGTIVLNTEYKNGSEFILELPAQPLTEEITEGAEIAVCDELNKTEVINIEFSDIYS